MLGLLWLPWLAAPALAGLAGAAVLPVARVAARWQWLVATVPVPIGAAVVTTAVVVATGSTAAGLVLSIVVQVLLCAAVAAGVGAWRSARYARRPGAARDLHDPPPGGPASMTSSHRARDGRRPA